MSNTIEDMKFKIVDNYYIDSEAVWDSRSAILSAGLFREKRPSGYYIGIEADNVSQLCFDLSNSYEIKGIELIGARFITKENLVLPVHSVLGNLAITNYFSQGSWQKGDEYEFKSYSLSNPVELTASAGGMLLRIGIDTQPVTKIIAASNHLIYALSGNTLQEIWITNPKLGR